MRITTYSQVLALAAQLAGRADDTTSGLRLPPSEAQLLLAFLAAELLDLWTIEAWPELCPDIAPVTLDADKTFSKREGEDNEMGDILSIHICGNPQLTTIAEAVPDFAEADGKVRVQTDQTTLYVEYQLPAPDLLTVPANELDAYELPLRFKNPLAFKAAGWLLTQEDPALSEKYRQLGNAKIALDAGKIPVPWWRGLRMKK